MDINIPADAYNQAYNPRYPGDVIFGVPSENEVWTMVRGSYVPED